MRASIANLACSHCSGTDICHLLRWAPPWCAIASYNAPSEGGTQAHVAEKGKTIKGVINDFLTGENGRTKRDHWVPRWMMFPPSAYTERGGVATVAAANCVRWQAEAEVPLDPDPAASAAVAKEDSDTETFEALEDVEEQCLAA